jgi:hypothetical protein
VQVRPVAEDCRLYLRIARELRIWVKDIKHGW